MTNITFLMLVLLSGKEARRADEQGPSGDRQRYCRPKPAPTNPSAPPPSTTASASTKPAGPECGGERSHCSSAPPPATTRKRQPRAGGSVAHVTAL